MTLQIYVTSGVAILGAALGVMNTWNAISQRRVRLRVKPVMAYSIANGQPGFAIEILNLSNFALTVTEVGFSLKGQRGRKAKRLMVDDHFVIDGKPWPRRLESREAVSVYFSIAPLVAHSQQVRRAYARTACGEQVLGDSRALKSIRDGQLND